MSTTMKRHQLFIGGKWADSSGGDDQENFVFPKRTSTSEIRQTYGMYLRRRRRQPHTVSKQAAQAGEVERVHAS